MSIYRSSCSLSELVEHIYELAIQGAEADRGSVRYLPNHRLGDDDSQWWLGDSKSESYLDYGRHHDTLGMLHAEIEPIVGEVEIKNNYSTGLANLVLVNLTHMKALLMTGSGVISGTHYEYEVITGSNDRAYSDDLVRYLMKARNSVFGG